jgi:hypothetical protein
MTKERLEELFDFLNTVAANPLKDLDGLRSHLVEIIKLIDHTKRGGK